MKTRNSFGGAPPNIRGGEGERKKVAHKNLACRKKRF